MNYTIVGLLIIVFLIGGMIYTGLQKIAPAFYRQLFFLLVMIVVNIFTGLLAFFMGAIATQTGGTAGFWLIFLAVEGLPFLLLILSVILLMRKVSK